jgi:hypothetical protein
MSLGMRAGERSLEGGFRVVRVTASVCVCVLVCACRGIFLLVRDER